MKLSLDHLESGQNEVNGEINDLGGKMKRKCDRMDGKMDRVPYGIITGLVGFVMKGSVDYNKAYIM